MNLNEKRVYIKLDSIYSIIILTNNMISKISIPLLLLGGTILSAKAQQMFIHGDHVDEGYLLGEKSQVVNIPTQQLSQFKCQFIDENYAINLQQLSIDAP